MDTSIILSNLGLYAKRVGRTVARPVVILYSFIEMQVDALLDKWFPDYTATEEVL